MSDCAVCAMWEVEVLTWGVVWRRAQRRRRLSFRPKDRTEFLPVSRFHGLRARSWPSDNCALNQYTIEHRWLIT